MSTLPSLLLLLHNLVFSPPSLVCLLSLHSQAVMVIAHRLILLLQVHIVAVHLHAHRLVLQDHSLAVDLHTHRLVLLLNVRSLPVLVHAHSLVQVLHLHLLQLLHIQSLVLLLQSLAQQFHRLALQIQKLINMEQLPHSLVMVLSSLQHHLHILVTKQLLQEEARAAKVKQEPDGHHLHVSQEGQEAALQVLMPYLTDMLQILTLMECMQYLMLLSPSLILVCLTSVICKVVVLSTMETSVA
jgi:hypothetical protein